MSFRWVIIGERRWEVHRNCHRIILLWVSLFFLKLGKYTNFQAGEKSPETIELRKKVSAGCEKLIWDFFEHGQVVIYDANNGTRAARHAVAEKFDKAGIHVIMLGIPLRLLHPQESHQHLQNPCATIMKS